MPARLQGLSHAILGRQLLITGEKGLVIKTNTSRRQAGQVAIALRDGRFQLSNSSLLHCTVNGKEVRQIDLTDGDEVVIGKDRFSFHHAVDQHDQERTQRVDSDDAPGAPPLNGAHQCSVCDLAITTGNAGWSDGERQICARCIAKGVKPHHLPRPQLAVDSQIAADTATVSDRVADEAPTTSPVVATASGDEPATTSASSTQQPPDAPATVVPAVTPTGRTERTAPVRERAQASGSGNPGYKAGEASSESDKMRQSRRISASRLTAVEPAAPARGGLLSKVGSLFGRRDERFGRLEDLEQERLLLYADAGRMSLGPGAGLGLPDEVVTALWQGRDAVLRIDDVSHLALACWRTQRQRLELLDAEVAAIRGSLALGADPGARRSPEPALRHDHQQQQERTFAALDGLSTDELSITLEEEDQSDHPAPGHESDVAHPAAGSALPDGGSGQQAALGHAQSKGRATRRRRR